MTQPIAFDNSYTRLGPGFYTRTGVGTVIAEGKEHKDFDGETYILERAIVADLSIVKGWKADESGNVVFRKTATGWERVRVELGRRSRTQVEVKRGLGAGDKVARRDLDEGGAA